MSDEKRAFKGIWIPAEIWLNKDLSVMEKLFLVEIDSLDNENGCYAKNKYFSEFFGISKGRCSQIIKGLEQKGLVKINYKYEGKEIKTRTIKVFNKLKTPIKFSKDPYLENDEDNNTDFNNTSYKEREATLKNLNDFFEDLTGGYNPNETIQFEELLNSGFETEVIKRAYTIAYEKGNHPPSYLKRILRDWKERDIKTMDSLHKQENRKKVQNMKGSSNLDYINNI